MIPTARKNSSKIAKFMTCQFFTQGSCSQASTHETRGVLYKDVCAFSFVSLIVEARKKPLQKQPSQGMSHFGAHAQKCRQIFGRHVDNHRVHKEIQATTASWLHWYHQGKVYTTNVGRKSYAQVVADCGSTHSSSEEC